VRKENEARTVSTYSPRVNAESDIRGLAGNYKTFVKIYPRWKNKERLKDSSIMLRMRVNLAVWLRVFAM